MLVQRCSPRRGNMPDVFNPQKRSEVMSSIRSRGNQSTEIRFISMMRQAGITGWRRGSTLPGKPDFVFSKERLAVFVDGDFWHGHPINCQLPRGNRAFWLKKIDSNRMRDKRVTRLLRSRGWIVMRFWESSLKAQQVNCVRRLRAGLEKGALQLETKAG